MSLHNIYASYHNRISELTKKTAMGYKQRMKMYRMLEKMTGEPASLQINEAIEELREIEVSKDLKSRLWYVYDDVIEQMRNSDADFANSLSKYVTQQDTMIIAASEQDDITTGFTTVIENNKKTSEMKKAFTSALSYPVLLLAVLLTLLYYFSVKVIPAFVDSIQPGVILSQSSIFLMYLSNNFKVWFTILIIFIIIFSVTIIWALPNFNNKYRKYLENIPPFNMYRIMVGCGFLFALNSLGRSGYMQYESLEQMVGLAKPYLKYRIQVIMEYMADGLDIGQALIQSKLDFPDKQMVRELAIQIKYSDDDSLESLSATLAEDGLETMKVQAAGLKFAISILVYGTIGYLYFAVYQFGIDLGTAK
jgi:type II secretory pathway component PulF